MNQSNQSKQVLLSVIGVAILVVAVVGVSFAFFNYTRTGETNTIKTGRIYFTSTQSGAIEVEDFFPAGATINANPTNSSSATITITGGTNYTGGLDYRLEVVDFTGTQVNTIPVQVAVAATSL